jgi:ArsR family transcriptional regulator, lead/cadmium/zinc/bismuth-responsive transcriptional repressor
LARPTRLNQIAQSDDPLCDDGIVHVESVRRARAASPNPRTLGELSSFFGVIADPNRLRIVTALNVSELCVCDIAASVGLSESAVSHHLRSLRDAGLVRNRRDGRMMLYSLDDDHVTSILRQALDHAEHRLQADPE